MAAVVDRARSCVVMRDREWSCAAVVRGCARSSCVVVCAAVVRGGRARSCVVMRGGRARRPCVVVRGGRAWSCVVVTHCRSARFAASTAVTDGHTDRQHIIPP